jgi:beta-glucosidase
MPERLVFPSDFCWGSATASFQVEGGVDERGQCIWDDFCRWPGKVLKGDTGDIAVDHYHLYKQDVALMSQLGLKGYRFSISWPRVLRDGSGEVNAVGLDYYDRLVDELLSAGIKPFVTLYHWDLPSALQRVGGWAARDTAYRFVDYVQIVADRLGDRVHDWITHNEPWVVAFVGNLFGAHAPGWQDLGMALQIGHHLLLSHGLAVPVIREASPGSSVGITLNLYPAYPASDSPEDVAAARQQDGFSNRWFLDPVFKGKDPEDMCAVFGAQVPRVEANDLSVISRPIDFLGINYYSRNLVAADPDAPMGVRSLHPEGEYTAMDWEVFPQGLTDILMQVHAIYGPRAIYVTENGCAYEDTLSIDDRVHDVKRTAYLRAHFAAAHEAIARGVPLKGYFIWSLMDNFEWALGYSRRFGIVYVDFGTLKRYPKDSALFCKAVAESNAVSPG